MDMILPESESMQVIAMVNLVPEVAGEFYTMEFTDPATGNTRYEFLRPYQFDKDDLTDNWYLKLREGDTVNLYYYSYGSMAFWRASKLDYKHVGSN
jgi:hypothetical protein